MYLSPETYMLQYNHDVWQEAPEITGLILTNTTTQD